MTTSTARDTAMATLKTNFAFISGYLAKLVADIPEEDMASQSEGVVNHPAWTLAHIAMANDHGASFLGLDATAPKAWHENFGGGSNPTPVRDDYPSKAEMLDVLDRQSKVILAALDTATPEQLDAPTPNETLVEFVPTVRDALVFFLTSHIAMHAGQVAAWRTANDLDRVLG